ncbi:MAG: S8 family peptidase [Myxococcota bacterium]
MGKKSSTLDRVVYWLVAGTCGALAACEPMRPLAVAPETVAPAGSPPEGVAPAQGLDRRFSSLFEVAQKRGSARMILLLKAESPEEIGAAQDRLLRTLNSSFPASVKRFGFFPLLAIEANPAEIVHLANDPDVVNVQEDLFGRPALAESGPLVGTTAAWSLGSTGAGRAIAILDTGIDGTHPFLSGKVVAEACYSSTTALSSTVCPNGLDEQLGPGAGVNCPSSIYGCDHGTHVAGIAAGRGSGFSGIAKDAELVAIQVFSRIDDPVFCGASTTPCVGYGTSDLIRGLDYVYQLRSTHSIAAVNVSLGEDTKYTTTAACDAVSVATKTAIDALRAVGIPTVVCSHNHGYLDGMPRPACISSAISVGATSKSDGVASFSNSASFLSLLAPGVSIQSSVPGGGFAYWNGTSMATPHVAGAWAVLKGQYPTATVDELLGALTSTGQPVLDPRNGLTKPRIQVDAALAQLDVVAPTITQVAAGAIISNRATITWTTDEPATSRVEYGLTTAYGNATPLDANLVTSHSVELTGLAASTPYHFRVLSADGSTNLATSGDSSFTTSAAPCIATGCSRQLCASGPVFTSCVWLPQYECYKTATCEQQSDGSCSWTMTSQLQACLASYP